MRWIFGLVLMVGCSPVFATKGMPRTKAPQGAEVYFISPKDGATLKSPVTVQFGLRGMGVAPAGVQKEKTGHHHLIVDTTVENYAMPIQSDKNHIHFGGGQTETKVELPPGKHKMFLLVGDHLHIPHDPPIKSKTITIEVK